MNPRQLLLISSCLGVALLSPGCKTGDQSFGRKYEVAFVGSKATSSVNATVSDKAAVTQNAVYGALYSIGFRRSKDAPYIWENGSAAMSVSPQQSGSVIINLGAFGDPRRVEAAQEADRRLLKALKAQPGIEVTVRDK